MYTWRHIAEAMPLFWLNDVFDNVPYESRTQILTHFEQFLFRTLGDESVQIPRSVAQQHPEVAHKLVDKSPAMHLQQAEEILTVHVVRHTLL